MCLWYSIESTTPVTPSILPMVVYPLFGVVHSELTCMSYTINASFVFMLACFVAITLENSKACDYMAYKWVSFFSHKPRRLHISVCLVSYVLSLCVQDAIVCALMIPLSRGIVQALENISIGHVYDETIEVQEDRPAYPTKLTIGFLLGAAFSVHIGGIATLSGSDVGYTLQDLYFGIIPGAKGGPITYMTYLAIAAPFSIILFILNLIYLQVIFLGLFRKNSPTNLMYDDQASKDAIKAAISELPPMNLHQQMSIAFWIVLYVSAFFLRPVFMPGIADLISGVVVKHSAILMLISLFLFYLPKAADCCPYFICRKPKSYATIPSILGWNTAQKTMPWNYFFIYSGSMAMGFGMKRTQWQECVNWFKGLNAALQIILWILTVGGISVIGSDFLIADLFIPWAVRQNFDSLPHPGVLMYAIALGCRATFFLPVSSVSNCFACGWMNIRARDVMLASIVPVLVGLLLSFVFVIALVPLVHPAFREVMTGK
uniref:Citrate transporter-like domain-containing protein n=1 Tax=Glossina brevipalpis TaxID=37001 RepID=A0A1A9WK63_9MUSC